MMPSWPTHCLIAAIGDLSSSRIWAIVLGVLFAVVAITLLVASWTKWGQTKSLTKCIALAFLAHVWLLMYAYGTRIVMPGFGGGNQGGIRNELSAITMNIVDAIPTKDQHDDVEADSNDSENNTEVEIAPWESPLDRHQEQANENLDLQTAESPRVPDLPTSQTPSPASFSKVESIWKEPELPPIHSEEQIEILASMHKQAVETTQPASATPITQPASPSNVHDLEGNKTLVHTNTPHLRKLDQQPVPLSYQMRLSPHRQQFAMQNGGDVNTEAAVVRALAWLAKAQSKDGGWNAAENGAGREPSATKNRIDSDYRHNAGLKANTAMTGLALLSFLGAGHTHTEGQYKDNLTQGLRYLLAQQFPSGDLSGRDQVGREPTVRFAKMYSHGMAALALTEAYGMTGDPALLVPIQAACRYTIGAMNPQTGGWRYEFPTEDPGDMSQYGWQAMVLNSSANNQAITLSAQKRMLMQRFLDSVSTGRYGGLAVYRPRSGQMAATEQASAAMTAEALASRLLLGFPLPPQAAEEAQRLMLKNLPGQSEENLYYWYYATMAMYQLRGEGNANGPQEQVWNQWNQALKQQLCSTQVPRGDFEGSWNPSCIWGGYGGRVYSTAFACMCLEVYYRYLPMYKPDQFATQWQPARR